MLLKLRKMHLHVSMAVCTMCMFLQVRGGKTSQDTCKNAESCLKANKDLEGISTLQHTKVKDKIMGTTLKTEKAEEERAEKSEDEAENRQASRVLESGYETKNKKGKESEDEAKNRQTSQVWESKDEAENRKDEEGDASTSS